MPDHEEVARPLVSVIMPCYNVESFARLALESVVNQTYRNLEIVIIDDGSTDDTFAVISAIAKIDNRIRLLQNITNLGIVATLNKGIAECTGKYITYMHADDVSSLNRIEYLMNFLSEYPDSDLVAAGYQWLNEHVRISAPMIPKSTLPKSIKFTVFLVTPMPHPLVLGTASVFRTLLYDPEYEYSEDYDLLSRASLLNYALRNAKRSLYFIRISNSRLSYRFASVQDKNHIRISRRNIQQYFGLNLEHSIHQIAVNRMQKSPTTLQLNEAFRLIDQLKSQFLANENCSSEEKLEIERVVSEQKIDILIQSMKYIQLNGLHRIVPILIKFTGLIISAVGFNYVLAKVNWRLRSMNILGFYFSRPIRFAVSSEQSR